MRGHRPPFDGNDYRKRVLAAVHRRGGPETADLFELYDLPIDEVRRWHDREVEAQVDEVWGFWQRQRDHPKYGTLVGQLVAAHDVNRADLLDRRTRERMADQVRAHREGRDAERFHLLDDAVARLVQRHGGIPRDKVEGLVEVGALGGLSPDEVHTRLRRHRVVDVAPAPLPPAPVPALVSDHRRQQVRDLLDEFGRLQEQPPPPTLLALLGLDPGADDAEVAFRAEGWRVRCRELPPLRIRAVADELMVHVADLLESGPIVRDAYLDAVVEDVRERLRPRVRAAVLVEDRLVADDHEHLYGEALALGLDPGRASDLLASIAAELGAAVEPRRDAGRARPASPGSPASGHDRSWETALRDARAALRRGRLMEARRLVAQASGSADPSSSTPVRAVADEVEQAVREAELRWRAAATALGARRFAEAVEHLVDLCRTAADLPAPAGLQPADVELDRARREVALADAEVEAARSAADPAATLAAVLDRWPAHPAAVAALAAMPLHPPTAVQALRDPAGAVVVTWQASATSGVTYRVARVQPDGTPRVVGRTAELRIEDGGAPAGPAVPDYVVVALQAGRASEESSTAGPPAPPAPPPPAPPPPAPPPRVPAATGAQTVPPAPSAVVATRAADGAVHVRWSGPDGVEFKVSRRASDGRWQVVGRTRSPEIEDGGAPPGDLPVYAVEARGDGGISAEALSASS
jgi:hypothetical protein